jgi:predicted DNA-binding protein
MKRTNIYIPDELLERMKAVAQGRKIAEMVREAIILWLAIEEKKR